MSSPRRRVRIMRGGMLPWPALQLSFALWLLYALAVVGITVSIPGGDDTLFGHFALLPPAYLIRYSLFAALAGFALISAARAVRALVAQWRAVEVELPGVRETLAEIAAAGDEYVLILRPHESRTSLMLPAPRSRRAGLRNRFAPPESLEQLVAREAAAIGKLRTIATVDPGVDQVSPGPDYVALGHDREAEIDALISRAWCVLLMIPPGHDATPALEEELNAVFRKGMIGRAALLLPTRTAKRRLPLEGLAAAMIPHASDAERAELSEHLLGDAILVHLSPEPEFWIETGLRLGPFAPGAGRSYARAVARCLREIEAAMPPSSTRYPYGHEARRRLGPRLSLVPALRSEQA